MKRLKAEELAENGVGKFIAIFQHHDSASKSFAKIVRVVPDLHLLCLEKVWEENEGEEFFAYYKVGTFVDAYDEDEAILLAFRNFDDTDPENQQDEIGS